MKHSPMHIEQPSYGLDLRGIMRHFGSGASKAVALDGVSLHVGRGEIVGLVGESGSGKSTLARIACGLDRPQAGSVHLNGKPLASELNKQPVPCADIQMVFQDPLASFNPRRSVSRSIAIPVKIQVPANNKGINARVSKLLVSVGLTENLGLRKPHELSGGQLQRAAIARALATDPDYLICDEAVASLDVLVRAQILELMVHLRKTRRIGILFVSHDLGVIRRIADRTVVLYLGRVVEQGSTDDLLHHPLHPYTQDLISAVPTGRIPWRQQRAGNVPTGEPGSASAIPSGCRYHPRCRVAIDICRSNDPGLIKIDPPESDRCVACVLVG